MILQQLKRMTGNGLNSLAAHRNAWWFKGVHRDSPTRLEHLKVPNRALLPCIFIDPLSIEYKCNIRGDAATVRRLFLAGDWDLKRKSFADVDTVDPRYVTCRELVVDELPIEETTEFRALVERLARHGEARGMRSRDAIIRYMTQLRTFYLQIKADGRLRTQAELGNGSHGGEINCAVGRDGVLLKTNDGNHRLAIARLLKLERVPAQISVMHVDLLPTVRELCPTAATRAVNSYFRRIEQSYSRASIA